jgi:putative PIN family toxin of toxin-antitoxin system
VIRVVIDPGVFVSVLIGSRGSAPDRVFNAWIDDRIEVIASPQLIAELRRVVQRPKFRRWFDNRTAQQLVERIERHATLHEDPPATSATRDPKDDYLVALARVAHVDAIISGDRDIHDAELPDLSIWTPRHLADTLSR